MAEVIAQVRDPTVQVVPGRQDTDGDEDEGRGARSPRESSTRAGRCASTSHEKAGRISSITIDNYRESERLTEILNTVGWTFSRMLEKGATSSR